MRTASPRAACPPRASAWDCRAKGRRCSAAGRSPCRGDSREDDCPGLGPVLQPVRLAVPPAVDGVADRVEARLVARVRELVEAVVLPEPARRPRRVARLGDPVRIVHDGRIGYRLRVGLVVVAEGELYQAAPAVFPAVAAGFVAVAVATGVDEIGDPLGLAVIAPRERVAREPRGPGPAPRPPRIVQVVFGAAEGRRFAGDLRPGGGGAVGRVAPELL